MSSYLDLIDSSLLLLSWSAMFSPEGLFFFGHIFGEGAFVAAVGPSIGGLGEAIMVKSSVWSNGEGVAALGIVR